MLGRGCAAFTPLQSAKTSSIIILEWVGNVWWLWQCFKGTPRCSVAACLFSVATKFRWWRWLYRARDRPPRRKYPPSIGASWWRCMWRAWPTRDLCLLHQLHQSIAVISRASRVSPLILICRSVVHLRTMVVGNTIRRVKGQWGEPRFPCCGEVSYWATTCSTTVNRVDGCCFSPLFRRHQPDTSVYWTKHKVYFKD